MSNSLIERLKGGFIVSCQALKDEPLYGPEIMVAMAVAAEQGGASAIRANSPRDIAAIKQACSLPVIGLYKKHFDDCDIYITPTLKEVSEVAEAGADMVAIDFTRMARPAGESLEHLTRSIKAKFPNVPILADVSTYEEGICAMDLGADAVSTTLSGYTSYSRQQEDPDIELVRALAQLNRKPVFAEGRIWTIDQCIECYKAGAHAVVVGTAITRPQLIVKRYVEKIRSNIAAGTPGSI